MHKPNTDVIQGTLDLPILETLSLEAMHGFGIARRVEQVSRGVFKVNPGSLLTARQRLERAGWLDAEWRQTANARRAKLYALTRAGRKPLELQTADRTRRASAVARLLKAEVQARVNLILLESDEVREDGTVDLSGLRARHLLQVLRVAPGDDVRVGVLDGGSGLATVTSLADGRVALRCRRETMATPVRPAVDLLLALPRPKVMRRLWAQLAALGVGQIILTNAARVERNYFDAHVLSETGYRPLLVEGLQQARDTRLPRVAIHRQFRALVEDDLDGLCPCGIRLVAHPGQEPGRAPGQAPGQAAGHEPGREQALAAVVRARAPERVLLAVGPEGGWNDFELNLLEAHGFQQVGMGPRTLRTDTACIALLALLHDALRAL